MAPELPSVAVSVAGVSLTCFGFVILLPGKRDVASVTAPNTMNSHLTFGFPNHSPSGTEKCPGSTALLPFVIPCDLPQPLWHHLSPPQCTWCSQGRQSSAWPLWLPLHPALLLVNLQSFINATPRGDLMHKGDHLIEFETNRHASE